MASGWPLSAFIFAAHDPEVFDRIIDFVSGNREMRPFANRLLTEISSGALQLSPAQKEIFDRYHRKLKRA